MKQQINPVVATIVVVLILGVVGFFIWRGTGNTGGPAPGEKGNPGPFSPGGAALGKSGSVQPPNAGKPGSMPPPGVR